eukprot:12734985-Prorocentrum_lima.AAC.1
MLKSKTGWSIAWSATSTRADAGISRNKRTSMEWCLGEATRDAHRRFLANVSTIALSLDEREGRMLL